MCVIVLSEINDDDDDDDVAKTNYPTVKTAPSYVHPFDTVPACNGRTVGQKCHS